MRAEILFYFDREKTPPNLNAMECNLQTVTFHIL